MPSNARCAASRALPHASTLAGGSPSRHSCVRRSEPRSTERTHAGPSERRADRHLGRATAHVDHRHDLGQRQRGLSATTPSKARRPSSSAESTRTGVARGSLERVHQRGRTLVLSPRRGDERADLVGPLRRGHGRTYAHAILVVRSTVDACAAIPIARSPRPARDRRGVCPPRRACRPRRRPRRGAAPCWSRCRSPRRASSAWKLILGPGPDGAACRATHAHGRGAWPARARGVASPPGG